MATQGEPFGPQLDELPDPEGPGVELVAAASREEMRSRAVELRVAGADYGRIASELGLTLKEAREHCEAWVRSRRPANELTDELQKLAHARLEILHEVWWPKALEGDERALDNVLKIHDRVAKAMGLEIKQPAALTIVTAESIVEALGLGNGKPPEWKQDAIEAEATA